jgi:transposase
MTLSTTAQISFPLDIPKVDVMGTNLTREGQFIITVESQEETVICGICQQTISCNYGHGQEIQLRHLPVLGYETYIAIRPRRGQCPTCLHQPTTTQQLEWYEPRSPHTKVYDRYLMKQLVHSTVADVSLKERVGYDAVLGVLGRQVPTTVNWDEIDNLGTIGIDEISLQKGHKSYRAVITARQDDGQVIILAVLTDRKKRR